MSREEKLSFVQALAKDGLIYKPHIDICQSLKSGKKVWQVANQFNVTEDHVYRVKRERCNCDSIKDL